MAFSLITSTIKRATSANNAVTTDAVDTTGAQLIVLCRHFFGTAADNATVSDSASNTWTALTVRRLAGTNVGIRLYYHLSPTTNASHTFTVAGVSNQHPTLSVMAFGGIGTFGSENGATTSSSVTSFNSGTVTPGNDHALVVAGTTFGTTSGSASVSGGGLAIAQQTVAVVGQAMAGALAYEIQTTAAARQAAWTYPASTVPSAAIATFAALVVPGGFHVLHVSP